MPGKFGTESWCADRCAFIFRYQEPLRGDRWTFCVAQSELADLATMQRFRPEVIFDIWRLRIYSAAYARMKIANPRAQQNLTSQDIRLAAIALPPAGYSNVSGTEVSRAEVSGADDPAQA